MTVLEKYEDLRKIIAGCGPMLVAYSGGVDSTLLAAVAREVLGEKTRCVLLESPVVPRAEAAQAQEIARRLGLALDIIAVPLMEHAEFCKNPADRCYFCRKISAVPLRQRAAELGFTCIADGINLSDTGEHRPGLRASTEEGIVHPFIEAGITKEEIRTIARELGLPVWQKPSAACLASRISYGDAITASKLQRIEAAETYLTGLGIGQLRVRLHGNLARIEVHKEDQKKLLEQQPAVVRHLKSLGFAYVTLDLEGYRSGSMDEVLENRAKDGNNV
jgi:pyridinium-3,5-biscarboxylic acid mononucleotide sulfurtransferase